MHSRAGSGDVISCAERADHEFDPRSDSSEAFYFELPGFYIVDLCGGELYIDSFEFCFEIVIEIIYFLSSSVRRG